MDSISLSGSVTFVTVPQQTKSVNKITVLNWDDNPARKTVTARTLELGSILLWSGSGYDTIGDWTTEQANAQLLTVLTGNTH